MDYIQNNRSLIRVLEIAIQNHWESTALSDYDSEVAFTFRDIAAQINRIHHLYREIGIQKGDKIAICDKNSSFWGVTFLSVITYGAVAVPVLADFNGEQIVNVVQHSDAKILVAGIQTKKKIQALCRRGRRVF